MTQKLPNYGKNLDKIPQKIKFPDARLSYINYDDIFRFMRAYCILNGEVN